MLPEKAEKTGGLYENRHLLMALGMLLVISNLPFGRYFLYPFELFSTWIHELCHGLAALAVGGEFRQLEIFADTSGRALTATAPSAFAKVIVSSAGYLGTTIFGVIMLFLQRPTKISRWFGLGAGGVLLVIMLWSVHGLFGYLLFVGLIAACLAMSLGTTEHDTGRVGLGVFGGLLCLSALFGRDPFTWLVLLGWGGTCLFLSWRASSRLTQLLFTFLSATCALNSLSSIRVLFASQQIVNGQPSASDAAAVSMALFGPASLWAGLWMLASLALLFWALRRLWRSSTLQVTEEVETRMLVEGRGR